MEKELDNLMSYTKLDLCSEIIRLYRKEDDLISLMKLHDLVSSDELNKLSSNYVSVLIGLMQDARFSASNLTSPQTIREFGSYLRTKTGKPTSKKRGKKR